MDQPPAVALTAFADAWPRAIETEIGAALCAIGAGRTLTFFLTRTKDYKYLWNWITENGSKERQLEELRHQRHQKYERQKYLGEVGIKAAREIIKTKLEMWDVDSNFGMERKCWCEMLVWGKRMK